MAAASAPYNPPVGDVRTESLGFTPDSCVRGTFRPGGSKSLAQRALLAAALAHGSTELENFPQGDDVRAALALLEATGVACQRIGPGRMRVCGSPPSARSGLTSRAALQVGESGTLARLATAALALASTPRTRWRRRWA